MKKKLIATAISTAITAAAAPNIAMAADSNNAAGEVMVITANRSAQQKFDVLAPVEVFERADIELLQPASIGDLLNRVAGITNTSTGTAANNTSLFVRGSNSDHVLILVDGVRIGSATLGQKNSADINMQMVERVEVIRGPRAALWGSDAIGGVIQIFTRKLAQGQIHLNGEVASNHRWRSHGAVGIGNQQHRYTLAANIERSDGFDVINPDINGESDDDGYDRKSLSLNGISQLSEDFSLGLSAQLDQGTTEFDSGFGGNEIDHDNHFIQFNGQFALDQATIDIKVANAVDENQDNGDERFAGSTTAIYQTKRDQVNVVAVLPVNEQFNLSGGIDWYNEQVTSHKSYAKNKRNAKAAFVVGRYDNQGFKLEASARHDSIGEIPSETTHQLAVGYQLSDSLLISASHGSAFKAPTFNDLYWPEEFGSKGNPNLKSELADNDELMMRYHSANVQLEVSVYQTDYENLIEWGYDSDTQISEPSNVDNAKIKGAEFTLNISALGLDHRINLSHIDAKNLATGRQLDRRPHLSGHYQVSYAGDGWHTSVGLNFQGKHNESTGDVLPGYTTADFSVSYDISATLTLRSKISNLTDKGYLTAAAWPGVDKSAYPGAQRRFSLALDYQF